MGKIRVLIADDHPFIRRGIKALIESQDGWVVCGEAVNGREAVEQASRLKPDVVVMDIVMPELNGIEATRQIAALSRQTEILILTMDNSEELARHVLRAGARGFILKSDADSLLVTAIESLSRHCPFLTSRVTTFVLDDFLQKSSSGNDILSPREREILQLIAEGSSNKEVATVLSISVKTVETHRANIMRKLELTSVTALVRYALRNRIATI
jgi:DNA-binding NarL/FixJ family response regulator